METTTAPLESPKVRWDLSALFSGFDDPKIEATWVKAEAESDAFAQKYRGKIADPSLTAANLREAVLAMEALTNEMQKPMEYGNLRFAVEATNPEAGAFIQAQMERSSSIRVKLIFFELEVQQIEDGLYQSLVQDPGLLPYAHFLGRLREATPFMLSEKEEALMEHLANTGSRAWVRLHDEVLTYHKFAYRNPENGETSELTQSEVLDLLRSPDRAKRIAAGDSLSAGLQQLNHILCFLYNTLLQDKAIDDKLRNRPYPEHSRHTANELDKEIVDLVMRLCKENEHVVARYYRLKREILGLPELTHVDRYAPLFETKEQIGWEKAQEMVLASFGQFSPTLRDRAAEFFDKNWIDAEARDGKTGGAFCSYMTPDLHPVVMMSYLNKIDDVMTLAHELGHGAHGSLSRKQTLFNFYGSLPLAELASIFGEQLVFENVVKSTTADDQLALYAAKIEGIFASVFRQSAMFRFEQRCHAKRREDGELAPEEFSEIWQDELQGMFGDSVKMEAQHATWWSYVGHFIFAPFYVYAYSFGELLTMALYERARHEGPEFEANYVKVLELGGSLSPVDLMKIVGVDLRDEAFWRGGFAVIDDLVAKFETLWQAR